MECRLETQQIVRTELTGIGPESESGLRAFLREMVLVGWFPAAFLHNSVFIVNSWFKLRIHNLCVMSFHVYTIALRHHVALRLVILQEFLAISI